MMQVTTLEHIAVIGAGLMGRGIAQVFARAGYPVTVYDPDIDALAALRERIARNLADLGEDTGPADRVAPVDALGPCVVKADVVIEAGPENLLFKQTLFGQLERLARPSALLASNTSVIPITDIMRGLHSGHRAMGTHWWNPPYLVPLVEVIKTVDTDPALARRMCDVLVAVGKTPALVEMDVPGFIGNRLQHALWREAAALVASDVCDVETVDTVLKTDCGPRLPVLGSQENAELGVVDLTLATKSGGGFRAWSPEEQAALRVRMLHHFRVMNGAEGR